MYVRDFLFDAQEVSLNMKIEHCGVRYAMEWKSLERLNEWTTIWNDHDHPRNGVIVRVSKVLAETADDAERITRFILDRYPAPSLNIVHEHCSARMNVPEVGRPAFMQFFILEQGDPGTLIVHVWDLS